MAKNTLESGRLINGGDFGKGIGGELHGFGVEIRRVDWNRDAKPIADMFNNPKVIKHEAGVAPSQAKRDIPAFLAHIERHIILSPGATMSQEGLKAFAEDAIIAREESVKAYFAKLSRVETYVVTIGGRVVGTASLEKPSPTQAGKREGTIFKVAVDPNLPKAVESEQGKGVGRLLVRTVTNRAIELSLTIVKASVIKGVSGYLSAVSLFEKNDYKLVGESSKDTLGWDIPEEPKEEDVRERMRKGKYVERDTIKMQLIVPSTPTLAVFK